MSAPTISRTAWIDDDGSGTTGTPINNAAKTSLYNEIDALAAALFAASAIPNPIAQDLLFTDATYDVGKSGATRPRDYFGSRDVTVGRNLVLAGSTSGTTTVKAAAVAGSTTLTLPAGTTDFTATGGTSQFVKQASAGAALTVAQPSSADLSDTVAWTDYTATSTIVGWSSFTGGQKCISYAKFGKLIAVQYIIDGTSNSTAASFTLPYQPVASSVIWYSSSTYTVDNGVAKTQPGRVNMVPGSAVATLAPDLAGNNWTASGSKIIAGTFFFLAA